jgi:VCBS repeat-containing protein
MKKIIFSIFIGMVIINSVFSAATTFPNKIFSSNIQNIQIIANDDYYITDEDTTLNVAAPGVLGNDLLSENGTLITILISDVTNGTLNLNTNGAFQYIPYQNYNGIDSFTYQAYNGYFYSNYATVNITIDSVNDIPIANDDYYITEEDIIINIGAPGILTNDTDLENDPLTAILISNASNGELNLNSNGAFRYTPDNNYVGSDSFTYQANDGTDNSNTATVYITITPVNDPPNEPSNPNPADGETGVSVDVVLSWTGGDPDGDDVIYDIYFGDYSPPPIVVENQTTTNYNPGTLELYTIYYWQIVAWDENEVPRVGPIWSFTSRTNDPPEIPSNPIPNNSSKNIDINTDLKWTGGDPNEDSVTYTIFFGKTSPPPLVTENQTSTIYDPGPMNYTTKYYWQIVSYDRFEAKTDGPIWTFTTEEKTNKIPIRPTITGVQGIHVPNRNYDYDIVTIDPDGDDVIYYIDWGDGNHEDWFGPFESGQNITATHAWQPITRLYEIRVKARDIYSGESEWGKLYVFVLNSRSVASLILVRFVVRLIEKFPVFEKIISSGPIYNWLSKI